MPLRQQWAHSVSTRETLRVLNFSVTPPLVRAWLLCICFFPVQSPLSASFSVPSEGHLWNEGWDVMKLDIKLIKYDTRIDVECKPVGRLFTSLGRSSLFTVCSICQGLQQGAIPGIIFQNEDRRGRNQLLRRVDPVFKCTEIPVGWFFLFWSSYKKCPKMALNNLIAMY